MATKSIETVSFPKFTNAYHVSYFQNVKVLFSFNVLLLIRSVLQFLPSFFVRTASLKPVTGQTSQFQWGRKDFALQLCQRNEMRVNANRVFGEKQYANVMKTIYYCKKIRHKNSICDGFFINTLLFNT